MSDLNRILALSGLAQNGIQKVKEGTEMGKIGDIFVKQFAMGKEKGAGIQLTSASGDGYVQMDREEAAQLAARLAKWAGSKTLAQPGDYDESINEYGYDGGSGADPKIVAKFARVPSSQRSYYVMKWAEENGIDSDEAMVMAGYEKGEYMGAGAYRWRYVGESVNEAVGDYAEPIYELIEEIGSHQVVMDELIRYLDGDTIRDFVADFRRHNDMPFNPEESVNEARECMVCKDCGDEMHKPTTNCPHDCHDENGDWWVKKMVEASGKDALVDEIMLMADREREQWADDPEMNGGDADYFMMVAKALDTEDYEEARMAVLNGDTAPKEEVLSIIADREPEILKKMFPRDAEKERYLASLREARKLKDELITELMGD